MTEARGAAPLENVLVVGGGQVALLAAIAVARVLPSARVTLVEAPVASCALADRVHIGLSGISALHARIGMDDALLLARAEASHCLATQHVAWRGTAPFWVGYGAAARDAAGGFDSGAPALAAGLAMAERFVPLDHPLAQDLNPALRWNTERYLEGLRMLARRVGVAPASAPFASVTWDCSGEVDGVRLTDSSQIAADLIVDASGPAALVHAASASPRVRWPSPVDRLCTLRAPAAPALSLSDRVIWEGGSYAVASPSRDGTRWWQGWSSTTWSDEEARVRLAQASGGEPGDCIPFTAGIAPAPWVGRTVAVGDAAVCLEPLGWLNLHVAAWQILLLIELLPGVQIHPAERAEFNRRAVLLATHAQDFVAAQHGYNKGSPALALRLDQFAHRGWLPIVEEDSIPLDAWAQLLIGQCRGPGKLPRLMALGNAERDASEINNRRRVERAIAAGHPYAAEFVRRR